MRRVVDHGQCGEAVARTELPAPARGDGKSAAADARLRRLAGRSAVPSRHIVGAIGRQSPIVLVNAERPVADGVSVGAIARHRFDCPLRDVGGHGIHIDVIVAGHTPYAGHGEGDNEEDESMHIESLIGHALYVIWDACWYSPDLFETGLERERQRERERVYAG